MELARAATTTYAMFPYSHFQQKHRAQVKKWLWCYETLEIHHSIGIAADAMTMNHLDVFMFGEFIDIYLHISALGQLTIVIASVTQLWRIWVNASNEPSNNLCCNNNEWSTPDSKIHEDNMRPIWGRHDPGGPHVGPMNFAIWDNTIGCKFRGFVDCITPRIPPQPSKCCIIKIKRSIHFKHDISLRNIQWENRHSLHIATNPQPLRTLINSYSDTCSVCRVYFCEYILLWKKHPPQWPVQIENGPVGSYLHCDILFAIPACIIQRYCTSTLYYYGNSPLLIVFQC